MRYVLLIYGSEAASAGMAQEERVALMQAHSAFAQEAQERSLLTGGGPLQPTSTATTVRVRNGKTLITDGPFAETKEQLAGFYVLNCKDLDEAILKTLLELEQEEDNVNADEIPDERLKLIFTCCHPALSKEAQVALTLHTLGGLTTPEIASAFLVALPTMAQRMVRAKHKIRDARIPYQVPPADAIPERIDALLSVLYLIFNAGYTAPIGDELIRHDLCREAIRQTRILTTLLTKEPALTEDAEAFGLLALMLLQDARRKARVNAGGELALLEDQDRTLWDQEEIAERFPI